MVIEPAIDPRHETDYLGEVLEAIASDPELVDAQLKLKAKRVHSEARVAPVLVIIGAVLLIATLYSFGWFSSAGEAVGARTLPAQPRVGEDRGVVRLAGRSGARRAGDRQLAWRPAMSLPGGPPLPCRDGCLTRPRRPGWRFPSSLSTVSTACRLRTTMSGTCGGLPDDTSVCWSTRSVIPMFSGRSRAPIPAAIFTGDASPIW